MALLDIGISTLAWAAIIFDQRPENVPLQPVVVLGAMTLTHGVDETTSVILNDPSLKSQAIWTITLLRNSGPIFGRIEGLTVLCSLAAVVCQSPCM